MTDIREAVERVRGQIGDIDYPKDILALCDHVDAMQWRSVKDGTLLAGIRAWCSNGSFEWFDFPRYRVVAQDCENKHLILAVLDPSGERIGTETIPADSDQYQPWPMPESPRTITVNGVKLQPCFDPKHGQKVWMFDCGGDVWPIQFKSDMARHQILRDNGTLHTTEEAAQAHYEALFSQSRRAQE